MLGEFLSPLLLITVIGLFVVALYLVWAMLSVINSLRRIADSFEKLVRKSDPTGERGDLEKWVLEEPSPTILESSIGTGPGKAQAEESFFNI